MKAGHSNLLGHLVEAGSVPHGGCADLQVVCPACREPVYKNQRTGTDRTLDYLAHYPDTKSDVDRCELRVAAMFSQSKLTEDEIKARGQNLRFFLAVMTDMIDEIMPTVTSLPNGVPNAIARSRIVRSMGDSSKPTNRQAVEEGMIVRSDRKDDGKTREVAGLLLNKSRIRLDMPVQKRYAEDFMRTLLTAQCTTAYRHLYRRAWLAALVYFGAASQQHPDLAHFRNAFDAGLGLTYDGAQGDARMLAMARDDAAVDEFMQTAGALTIRILLCLDYAGWLKRRLEEPRLQALRWTPDRVADPKPKRKPRPKRTHRR